MKAKLFGLVLPTAWLLIALIGTLAAPWLPFADPLNQDLMQMSAKPGAAQWFGADSLGRDVLARSVYGLRVTFIVGIGSVVVALLVGGSLGLIAGYFRGRTERIIMACNNVLLAFPPLVLAVAIMAYPGNAILKLVLVLGLVLSSAFTRIARVNTLMFAQQEFVTAARAIGMRDVRIMLSEILPNLITPLSVFALLAVALASVAESTLSFLGLSVSPPTPTLGNMIASEISSMREAPHAVFFPAGMLFLTIFALNRLGEYLQRKLDVRESAA